MGQPFSNSSNLKVRHVRARIYDPEGSVHFERVGECPALKALTQDDLEYVSGQDVLLGLHDSALVRLAAHARSRQRRPELLGAQVDGSRRQCRSNNGGEHNINLKIKRKVQPKWRMRPQCYSQVVIMYHGQDRVQLFLAVVVGQLGGRITVHPHPVDDVCFLVHVRRSDSELRKLELKRLNRRKKKGKWGTFST